MGTKFPAETFRYFKLAAKNRQKKEWFEKNRELYESAVREPFALIVTRLHEEFGADLPKIEIAPKKIVKPLRRNYDVETGVVRSTSSIFLSEKPTSRFEWNPGIYIAIGNEPDDNAIGLGLYMISSRQMSRLRDGLVNDFDQIHSILSHKKFKARWGGLSGDLYKRFPKGFDEDSEAASYLSHKQFYVSDELKKTSVLSSKFADSVVKSVEVSIPFLTWIRETVGTYRR